MTVMMVANLLYLCKRMYLLREIYLVGARLVRYADEMIYVYFALRFVGDCSYWCILSLIQVLYTFH